MNTNHRLGNTVGATRRRGNQVLASEQDVSEIATKVKCNDHYLEYYVARGDKAKCPMCDLERQHDELKVEVLTMRNEMKQMADELQRTRVQIEIGAAIKSAIAILDDNDYAWLKVQMYQYKTDKSITLKPIHGTGDGRAVPRGEKLSATGFMSIPRRGDPEAHVATSFGGIAMAGYLDEALTCYGSAQGMGIMLKAWWQALPGAQS